MKPKRALAEARKMLNGKATGYRYAELARLLEAAGFTERGAGGSHRIWKHRNPPIMLTVVDSGSGTVKACYAKAVAEAIILAIGTEGVNDAAGD